MNDKKFSKSDLIVLSFCICVFFFSLAAVGKSGRERAKMLVCQTHLRQWAQAESMYAADNDGYFPNAGSLLFDIYSPGGSESGIWSDTGYPPDGDIWPYLQNRDVIRCPTFARVWKERIDANPMYHFYPHPEDFEPQFSYVQNAFLGRYFSPGGPYKPCEQVWKSADVVKPEMVFLFTEQNPWITMKSYGAWADLGKYALDDNNLVAFTSLIIECFATFHMPVGGDLDHGYANAAFVDGHVEKVCAWEPSVRNSKGQYVNTGYLAFPYEKSQMEERCGPGGWELPTTGD